MEETEKFKQIQEELSDVLFEDDINIWTWQLRPDRSFLDSDFSAEQLRKIADVMDKFKKMLDE